MRSCFKRGFQRRINRRGMTLMEVVIALAVLAMISMLLVGAFSAMRRAKKGIQRVNDRYREGRMAMARLQRDLSSAYVSLHAPIDQSLTVWKTQFVGAQGSPADRLDFNTFAYRRIDRNAAYSDQAEVSYFASEDPEGDGAVDLARRINPRLDLEPDAGGRVQVLATNIDLFDVTYLDPLTGQWKETWDTTQATGEKDRLPLQIRIVLVLNGGERETAGTGRSRLRFVTKVAPAIPKALRFAIQ